LFLRPAAAFPDALVLVLEIVESVYLSEPRPRIARELERAGPDFAAAAGRLLWTVAGLRSAPDANLMTVQLDYGDRVNLHALAQRFCDAVPAEVAAPGRPTGRAASVHNLVAELGRHLGETRIVGELAERLRALAEHGMHPQSALQGCAGAAQLFERPRSSAALLGARGQPLSPAQQLAAWVAILEASPPRALVELLLPRFEALRSRHPGLPGMAMVTARMHDAARTASARQLASAWVVEQPEDPQALLCRMTAALRAGDTTAALDDAMAAVQRALDRGAAIAAVTAACAAAAEVAPAASRAAILALADSFRALPP
jgi:hypothetical protein